MQDFIKISRALIKDIFLVLILKCTADIVASDPGRMYTYVYVRGSGISEDGKTKSLTMPSEEAQHDLISEVQAATLLEHVY